MATTTKKKQKKVKRRKVKKPAVRSDIPSAAPETVGPKITPHPTAAPEIRAFEDALDEKLAGAESKRPVGRPRKQKESPAAPAALEELSIEIVAGTVKLPFELWAIGQGVDELALTDDEALQLAEPLRKLIEHYLPQIPPIAYAWIGLSVSSFWIMRSRLLLIAEIKAENLHASSPEPQAENDQGPGPGPGPGRRSAPRHGRRPGGKGSDQGIDQSKIKPKQV